MKRTGSMATKALTVNGVVVRGHEHGDSTKWWTISTASAKKIMRSIFPDRRPPRPGYEVLMPASSRNGHSGQWALKNLSGKYELQFYYR